MVKPESVFEDEPFFLKARAVFTAGDSTSSSSKISLMRAVQVLTSLVEELPSSSPLSSSSFNESKTSSSLALNDFRCWGFPLPLLLSAPAERDADVPEPEDEAWVWERLLAFSGLE